MKDYQDLPFKDLRFRNPVACPACGCKQFFGGAVEPVDEGYGTGLRVACAECAYGSVVALHMTDGGSLTAYWTTS
jgi:hypothetical protein